MQRPTSPHHAPDRPRPAAEPHADEAGPLWRLGGLTTSRAGAWITLVVALLLSGALMSMGSLESSTAPDPLPASTESARASELLRQFPDGDVAPAIAVFSRPDGGPLTPADLGAAQESRARMLSVDRSLDPADDRGAAAAPAIPSPDGRAALAVIPISTQLSGFDLLDAVDNVREAGRADLPEGLQVQLTGGPAFGGDIAGAFSGADVRLLLITAAVVAVLLLLTYRSPILWLVPLFVVALADRVAQIVAARAGEGLGLALDGSTNGIVSVLVFGAGTNYALLMVSRYREELRRDTDHRLALRRAVRHTAEPILASNVTVVLAVLTLVLASVPSTHILGISSAIGLATAVLFALFVLPAALAVCGRGLFWPFVPRVGDRDPAASGGWHTLASFVVARPLAVLAATVPVLLICGAGIIGVRIGLEQTEQFRVSAESVDGFGTLRDHFPAGQSNPTTVVARTEAAARVDAAIRGAQGVESSRQTGASDGGLTRWQVVLDGDPASAEAFDAVRALRANVHAVPDAQALVGGTDAATLDSRDAARGDLIRIVPLILAVVLFVLFVLLRAVLAPLLLITATTISSLAAIGAGAWLSTTVFGFPGLDTSVLLFSFLFLVALGVDYTIFLVTRVREETNRLGTRQGIVRGVSLTGGVITSAGIVLAAVFAVLGVLPLITLTQVGITVGIGILLDTFVVRTIVIPALFTMVGPRVWWPALPAGDATRAAAKDTTATTTTDTTAATR